MKRYKQIKKLAALICGAILTIGMAVPALAGVGSVTYEGGAEAFVFVPGEDLFQDFKGVMPGDTLTQQIGIKNTVNKSGGVRIYLRAESTSETVEGFLSQMTLTVRHGEKVLSDTTADQTGGLAAYVLLGNFYGRGETELNVSLQVPIEMGNEFQNAAGTIRWVFTVEEYERSTGGDGGTTTTIIRDQEVPLTQSPIQDLLQDIFPEGVPLIGLPKTGEVSGLGWLTLVTLVSTICLFTVLVVGKKRKRNHKA